MILKTPSMDIIDRIKAINYPSSSIYKNMSVIENYIYALEQRIAELEAPKTCDGCKWLTMDKMKRIMVHRFHGCFVCSRRCKDNYEPKEPK